MIFLASGLENAIKRHLIVPFSVTNGGFSQKGCAFHQVGVQCKFSTCRKKGSASVHYFVKQTITLIFMFIV